MGKLVELLEKSDWPLLVELLEKSDWPLLVELLEKSDWSLDFNQNQSHAEFG
jgi:hypothetical protein